MAVKKKKTNKKFSYRMKKTLVAVMLTIAIAFIALIFRVFFLIDQDQDRYKKRVLAQQSYISNEIKYRRGDIVDRNGTTLAISVKVYDAVVSPSEILSDNNENNRDYTIKTVAEFFKIDEEELRTKINERPNSKYMLLEGAKGLSADEKDKFNKLVEESEQAAKEAKPGKKGEGAVTVPPVINGVWFEERFERKYPLSTVACKIIGFVDGDMGNTGIEEYYNDSLSGSNGREYGYYDSELNLQRTVKAPINGDTVISSIDANVQGILEKKVDYYMKEPGAKNVAVMLMDPNNGEVIAMASNGQFDLNNPRDLSAYYTDSEVAVMSNEEKTTALNTMWKNFCISDTYEPGSTFKNFTVAAALDEGTVNANTTFNCEGKTTVADYEIGCANRVAHGIVTPKKALMESCNVALLNMALGLGRDQFYRYMNLYGFGKNTGIDMRGEQKGIIHKKDNLNSTELATSSFGQTQNVTMVQMLSAFCSLINGGKYYQPHVVKEIVNEQGGIVEKMDGKLLRHTVTSQTSDFIKDALLATVKEGTAKPAAVPGYEISGKTGTAEKHEKDSDGKYLVSFIGFVPYDKPQLAIYVIVDEPNVEDQAHSTYATEFASEIMKEILPFLGLYADEDAAGANDEEGEDGDSDNKGPSLDSLIPGDGVVDDDLSDVGTQDGASHNDESQDNESQDSESQDSESQDSTSQDVGSQDDQSSGDSADGQMQDDQV